MNDLQDMMAMFSGVAMGVYLIAVVLQGNTQAFIQAVIADSGYLQFIAAVIILMIIHSYLPGSIITDVITGTAILGALLIAVGNTNVASIFSSFGSGQITMWQAITALFGGATSHPLTVSQG